MRKVTLLIVFMLINVSIQISDKACAQALIIDHTVVRKFDVIPEYWLKKAQELTMHYAHASHGMQIISGLKYLKEYMDPVKYNVSYILAYGEKIGPRLPVGTGHLICDTGRKPDGYWATEEGKAETMLFANSGLYNFSMFGWCSELSNSRDITQYIEEYLETLDMFEKEYPGVRFIYQTGHTDGNPPYSRLKEHNEIIREYCRNNDKILYDFADIESWDPEGNYYANNNNCSWCEEWCTNHPEDCVNLLDQCEHGIPTCCPHTHGYNCYIKAKAYWYMLARLAGWDGLSQNEN